MASLKVLSLIVILSIILLVQSALSQELEEVDPGIYELIISGNFVNGTSTTPAEVTKTFEIINSTI